MYRRYDEVETTLENFMKSRLAGFKPYERRLKGGGRILIEDVLEEAGLHSEKLAIDLITEHPGLAMEVLSRYIGDLATNILVEEWSDEHFRVLARQ